VATLARLVDCFYLVTFHIPPGRLLRVLVAIIALLTAAHLAAQAIVLLTSHDWVYGFVPRFHFDRELTVPAWYSSCALLLAAALLFVIALNERQRSSPFAGRWFLLAFIFVALSLDEAASLHELLGQPVNEALANDAIGRFAWLLPALVLLMILAVGYVRWFFALPRDTRRLSGAAAALFLGGSVGAEVAGGLTHHEEGVSPLYLSLMTLEELLEMSGVAVWVYALARYAGAKGYELRVRFAGPPPVPAVAADRRPDVAK